MKAFIQIATETNDTKAILEKLNNLPEVEKLYVLFGKWDIVAIADVQDADNLGPFIIDNIRTLKGVRDTATQIVASTYPK